MDTLKTEKYVPLSAILKMCSRLDSTAIDAQKRAGTDELITNAVKITTRTVMKCAALDAVDGVVPVVRCKDCKHAHMTVDGLCKYCDALIECGVDEAVYLSGDFFCADGEKKDGDGE